MSKNLTQIPSNPTNIIQPESQKVPTNIPKPIQNQNLDRENFSEFSGYRGYERQKKESMREKALSVIKQPPVKIHKESASDQATNPYHEKLEKSKIRAENKLPNDLKKTRNILRKKHKLFPLPDKLHSAGNYLRHSEQLNLFRGRMLNRVNMQRQKDLFLMNLRRKKQ